MRKYYKILRIDIPTVEICADKEWKTYDLEQKCLIPDVGIYETEKEAESISVIILITSQNEQKMRNM